MESEHLASKVSSLIRIREEAVRPGTPHLTLQMTGSPKLSLHEPYHFRFFIRRPENDGVDRPCVVFWSPDSATLGSSGLVLLHHNAAGGLDPVPVDHTGVLDATDHVDSLVVQGWERFVWELKPGGQVDTYHPLPERFHEAMRAGETYTLLYPGHEILMWEWCTKKEVMGREIKKHAPAVATREGSPNPVIPGGPTLTFKAVEEDKQRPNRATRLEKVGFDKANCEEASRQKREESPPPMGEEERSPGAPIITATLSCSPHLDGDEKFSVQVTYTYEGTAGHSGADEEPAQPITIHIWLLYGVYWRRREAWRLDRWVPGPSEDGQAGSWQECELEDGEMGFLLVDEDVDIHVGRDNRNFVSLMPGESWTTSNEFSRYIPTDVAPGDTFRCRHKGVVLDWWDWGTMADHVDTVVKLPSWIAGRVTEPADNGGRPKLVVPGAKEVKFTYTGVGKGVEIK